MRKIIKLVRCGCLASLLLCGCGNVVDTVQESVVSDNTVMIETQIPQIGTWVFCVSDDEDLVDVTYGYGENYLWVESGLPGFDYQMVVEGFLPLSEHICITTDYGEYNYDLIKECLASESGHTLSEGTTRLTNFGKKDEIVWFWDGKNCRGYRKYDK